MNNTVHIINISGEKMTDIIIDHNESLKRIRN